MIRLILALLLLMVSAADAGTISRSAKSFGGTSFVNGVIPTAADFNGDIDTIISEINGNLDNDNLAADAAIAATKINPDGFTTNVRTLANAPCTVLDEQDQAADSKRWAACLVGGEFRLGTYTDANAAQITHIAIARNASSYTFTGSSGSVKFLVENSGMGIEINTEHSSNPAAPSANGAKLFLKDDGSGNTDLMAMFPTGDPVVVATQGVGGPRVIISTQSGTTYTLVAGDAGEMIDFTNGSAITLTVPANASVAFPIGTHIMVRQAGAGQITVAAAGGVTLQSAGSLVKTSQQYAVISLIKTASDTWSLSGSLGS